MNQVILFTYTKLPDDHFEYVLHVSPAQQAPQDNSCTSQFLRSKLLTFIDDLHAATQHSNRLLQQFSLPRPPDQAPFRRTEKFHRKDHNGGHQLHNTPPPRRRNSKFSPPFPRSYAIG